MVYDHIVKINGQYYESGKEIPQENNALKNDEIRSSNTHIINDQQPRRGRPRRVN